MKLRPEPMKFISPRADFAFKRIFGSEADTSKLISLLNAILANQGDERIVTIDILNPYNAPKIAILKDSYLDLRARDANGKQYLIEMQVANVQGMHKRVLYNTCKQYGNQLNQGDDYLLLSEVIGITFTDFVLFDSTPELRNSFMLRDALGNIYTHDLELIFIELPKFTIGKDELQQLRSDFDRWMYFLKHADGLPVRPKEFDSDPAICSAFEAASVASMSAQELDLYEDNLTLIRDQRGRIAFALDQGMQQGMRQGLEQGLQQGIQQGLEQGVQQGLEQGVQQGLEQGMQQGLEQGRTERERELIIQARQNGWSLEQISSFFKLSPEQVQAVLDSQN